MNKTQLDRLLTLLAQPTAPFREELVATYAEQLLRAHGVPCFRDPVGNLVVGAASRADYLRLIRSDSEEPVRVFIAHMDHPGCHGLRWSGRDTLRAQWHGGAPVRHLRGARLWLADATGYVGEARIVGARLSKSGRMIETLELQIDDPTLRKRPAKTLYGGFGFRAPVWRGAHKLYTKAADDLVGVFAILETARKLFARTNKSRPPFLALLTRAEEVGFVGAIAHFELGWLDKARRPVVCVSLEASRTLPGARVGKGPIVRLGDRRTVFAADATQLLSMLAEKTLPKAHQRRIMDGGACEATAATAYGHLAIGLSVPLGNYHNEGYEGGPDCKRPRGPAPEFVDVRDIEGLLSLCQALMRQRLPWGDAWRDTRARLKKNLHNYRKLL